MSYVNRRHKGRLLVLGIIIGLLIAGCAGTPAENGTPLPFDPSVQKGTLENGLTYFIRENSKPENRISLRLYVNAGSVLEDEDQEGIAHLLEHMAFNGSTHFKKQELERFLESLGMEFGPDLNAYTSFEETVYRLEIPADDEATVRRAFLVLQDWANGLLLEKEAIDAERLVVREEWRLRRGAEARIRDAQIPKLLEGSRYAERIPIGDMQDVMNTPVERIRDYYRTWYRPELMAVSVVGEIEPSRAEELVREYFSYPAPEDPVKRPSFDVPLSQTNEALVLTDPELTIGRVEVMTKLEPRGLATREDYADDIREILYWNMLNSRLEERTKEADPPFLRAGGSSYPYVRAVELSYLTARGRAEELMRALEALLTEARRAAEYGFSRSELERESARVLKAVENAYLERENRESSSLAREIGDYFLEGTAMPGIEYEYRLFQEEIPRVSLDEVNALSARYFPEEGRLITLSIPDSAPAPSAGEVMALYDTVMGMEIDPYEDDSLDEPLISALPAPGSIAGQEEFETIGATLFTLSNGIRVAVKPTDLQQNRVHFSAFSPGGESLLEVDELPAARTATLIRQESGFGEYNASQLEKYLADKDVSLESYIGRQFEGMSGGASSADLEYLFQLIRLAFTAPRFDSEAFESVKSRLTSSVANRDKSPQTLFSDTLNRLLSGDSPRREPFTLESVAKMDLAASERIYRERFSNPADFTLVFVGNVDPGELAALSEIYLANLPSSTEREEALDRGIRPVERPEQETVYKGIEEKATAALIFNRPMEWSEESAVLTQSTASILENILGERIREELGGTYSISAWGSLNRRPYEYAEAGIYFGSDPARVEELVQAVLEITAELATQGPEERFIDNAEEAYRRNHEEQLRENSFWLSHIESSLRDGEDPDDLLTPPEYAEIIDAEAVRLQAEEIFRPGDLIEVRLLPEN